MTTTVWYEQVGHFIRVPVQLGQQFEARFVIDSGIGVTVVAPSVSKRMNAESTGETFWAAVCPVKR